MNPVLAILGMGATVYTLRLAGLVVHDVAVPRAWARALAFVPVALLTALVVSSLVARPEQALPRSAAAAMAALVARRTGKMWACILSGMVIFWIVRLI